MAKGIEKSVQYLLIVLGAIVVALAVWMAKENMWWIAVPDAIFGIGIAWFSWIGLSEHKAHPVLATEAGPSQAPPLPPPPPLESHGAGSHETEKPAPAVTTAPSPLPTRHKKKRRH